MLHMLGQVALLAEIALADLAFERLFAFMHSCMIQEAPGLGELFRAAIILTLNDLSLASVDSLVSEPEPVSFESSTFAFGLRSSPSFSLFRGFFVFGGCSSI